ncbi:hypothetical protein [Paenibacillus flagellatus]|uniref:Uncharacterized protein n=1 Tax=Paenibacillus flagellatus TaxID=2211139 RepID=A0A2V5KC87_9BACL|nr:hypothetical protein [Paenibacillus flagellatus]PYI51490.1 hypothetical protein DLM86_23985 [Paenibacillus flagellatus]
MNPSNRLSKPEYDVLLSYVGCGSFPGADIIVFGNEEGTGGYSVGANVEARLRDFGRDAPDGAYRFCIHGGDWTRGFYEPNAGEGGGKVERYLRPGEKRRRQHFTKGVFNPAVARICLAFEEPDGSWFESGRDNPRAWARIKRFIGESLYKPRTGVQTALADWRPLPREKEDVWYPEEYGAIAESIANNPYLAAFNHPAKPFNASAYGQPLFSDFGGDVRKRADLLKSLFVASKAKVVIGIGGAGANGFKKQALELMFGPDIFKPLTFRLADMTTKRGAALESYRADIRLAHKSLHLFLVPFPSPGTVFKTQRDALSMLKELADDQIRPALLSGP